MNKIIIMGRLTREVEYKPTNSGGGYARFAVAVDRPKAKNQDKAETDFINCVAFNKTAETISKFFHKGNKILIEGALRIGSYENKDGQKVNTADVYVNAFEFVESKAQTNEAPKSSFESMGSQTVPFDEEVPF